jgi:hypothetical protein
MNDATPPADWYDDPENPALLRYWDGTAWTEHRSPKYAAAPVPQPASPPPANQPPAYGSPPAYAAQPGYGAQPAYGSQPVYGGQTVRAPGTPVAPGPLLAAGALLILAGIGRAVSYFAPYDATALTIAFSALEIIGWIGAYLAFLMAGYPRRSTATRVLAGILIALYAITGIIGIAITANPYSLYQLFPLVGILGLGVLGVGIGFGVVALRTPGLARRIAALPLALYGGLFFFGIVSASVNANSLTGAESVVVGGVSGLVPIAIGALFLAFGRQPHSQN